MLERRELLSALFWVTTAADDGSAGSLRGAIVAANASGAPATIDFDIADSGPVVIHLQSALPPLANATVIDGTTENGYAGAPLVALDGSGLSGPGNDGLVVTAGNSTIKGLALYGFSDAAIVLKDCGNNIVQDNYLGPVSASGPSLANGVGLLLLGSSNNTLGGVSGGAGGNVISGNSSDGVRLQLGTSSYSSNNLIVGNRVGTTADGLSALGNAGSGVAIVGGAGNTIGLPGPGEGNLISGNLDMGIDLSGGASGTLIQGNTIGLAVDGKTPLGNARGGVALDDAQGTAVGGAGEGAGNVVASNRGDGIHVSAPSTGTAIAGNWIGTDPSGALSLGNLGNGVLLASSSNTVGGLASGAGNVIAFNGQGTTGAGVQLSGPVDRDLIVSNRIYGNAGLGINLGGGPTPNHAPGTSGPNDYQNYPVLSLAQSDGGATTITGTLDEDPNTSYVVQFFSSPAPDPSGYGQAQSYLGSSTVTTDANGHVKFSVALAGDMPPGQYVTATATDPNNNTSEFALDVSVTGQINLVLTAAGTPNPVLAGGAITYVLNVANQGYADAHNVSLSDALPAGLTVTSATTSQGLLVPSMPGGPLSVYLGALAAGASATVTIVAQTSGVAVGTIANAATVTSQEANPSAASETATVETSVLAAADLSVSMAEGPAPALAGGDLTYTIVVSNQGPCDASNAVLAMPVPSGASFVSASTAEGAISNADQNGTITVPLGALAAGGRSTIAVVLQALAAGDVTATATVASATPDPDTSNNTTTVDTTVSSATDLVVKLSASWPVVAPGVALEYVVEVTNNGPLAATNVLLSDTLPAGVAFVSAATDQAGVSAGQSGNVVSATFPSLAVGASARMTIQVTTTAADGATLIDRAAASSALADPDPANDQASLDVPVRLISDLAIVASARPGTMDAGQPFTYTITVTNAGPNDEPDAVVSAALPAGLTVTSATASQGTSPVVSNGTLTADLGPLAAGAGHSAVITLLVVPGASAPPGASVNFVVAGQNHDPAPSNNTAATTVEVAPAAALAVALLPGAGPAVAGANWTYTLKVTNSGPSMATNVVATATLPPDATVVSATPSQGADPAAQNGVLTAALGTLASGASATIAIVIQPSNADAAAGSIALGASARGDQDNPAPANAEASIEVAVAPSVNLALTIAGPDTPPLSGHSIAFAATVVNLGATTAHNVVVMLPQAAGLLHGPSAVSQGDAVLVAGQLFARFGDLAPGASATVRVTDTATVWGDCTFQALLSDTEYNLNPGGAAASATVHVQESAGVVQFDAPSYTVNDQAGSVTLWVVRQYGASGPITLNYRTVAVVATPGLDYVPVQGTIALAAGQWSADIVVPVLRDRWENHDNWVDVVIEAPTGGAVLGGAASTSLHIVNTDPNTTPPRVTGLAWTGTTTAIGALTLNFSAPLDPTFAANPANYHLWDTTTWWGVPIASVQYTPWSFSVTVVPASPLPSGRYFQIQVVGTGASAVRDVAGNVLDGDGAGTPGSNYVALFGQGRSLRYTDAFGNRVALRIQGRGFLKQVRDASGAGVSLDVVGMVPHRTTLVGRVKNHRRRVPPAQLGTIGGLGQFGQVRVHMKTPPFAVRAFPFVRRGVAVL